MRPFRCVIALAALFLITSRSPAAQTAGSAEGRSLDDLIGRMASYVAEFIPRVATVVAAETYQQSYRELAERFQAGLRVTDERSRTIRLRSEVLLVRPPELGANWMLFRDVVEVDGKSVHHEPDRLMTLFAEGQTDAVERAARIAAESARFHAKGGTFSLTNPLLGVALMQRYYHPQLRFSFGGEQRVESRRVRILRFEEREQVDGSEGRRTPPTTILGAEGRVSGSVWVEPESGTVLRTDTHIGTTSTTVTTFAHDERLDLWVPGEMRTTWFIERRPVNGVAAYSNFRRFDVRTDATPGQTPQP